MNDIGQHPLGKNIATLFSSYRVVSNYLADTDSSSQPWFPEHGQGAFSVTLSHVGCSSAAAVQEASTGLAAGFPWCLDGFCSKHRLLERSKMNGGVFHCFLSSYSDCCSGSHNSFPSRGSWATFSSKRYLKKKKGKIYWSHGNTHSAHPLTSCSFFCNWKWAFFPSTGLLDGTFPPQLVVINHFDDF